MQIDFTKMHGAGNVFVVLDERVRPYGLEPRQLALLADHRAGVGCDQIIVLGPAIEPGDDAAVRFFNRDGSEAGACGNGTRCAAALVADGRSQVRLRSPAGLLTAELLADDQVRVDMGRVRLDWQDVPLSGPGDTLHLDLPGDPAACSMGNPHATLFVADLDAVDTDAGGAALERNGLFPQGANIGFAQMLSPGRMRLRVWERGTGATLACGSGACAAVVNAHRRGLAARECAVEMPGGLLHVAWRADQHVLLTGPTAMESAGSLRIDP